MIAPDQKSHRATLLLVIALTSPVLLVTAPIAWKMASRDVSEMEVGRMDTEGLMRTEVALMIGMMMTMLIVMLILYYAAMLAWASQVDLRQVLDAA